MENQKRQNNVDNSLIEIGQRIKKLREEKGWTQEQLASKLFLNRSAWKEKEDGRADMKTGTVVQLARLFGVTTDFILTGVEAHNTGIASETGLDDEVINYLRKAKQNADSKIKPIRESDITLSAVNTLLGTERGRNIIEDIWQYLQANYNPPFTGVTDSAEYLKLIAIAYEAKTTREGEKHQLFIQADKLSGALNNAHLGHITAGIKALKKELTEGNENGSARRGRKKEGTDNASKE